jgi:hypothetical protein
MSFRILLQEADVKEYYIIACRLEYNTLWTIVRQNTARRLEWYTL